MSSAYMLGPIFPCMFKMFQPSKFKAPSPQNLQLIQKDLSPLRKMNHRMNATWPVSHVPNHIIMDLFGSLRTEIPSSLYSDHLGLAEAFDRQSNNRNPLKHVP